MIKAPLNIPLSVDSVFLQGGNSRLSITSTARYCAAIYLTLSYCLFPSWVHAETGIYPAESTLGSFDGIECGSEARIFRERARRLRQASAACQQDIAAGHPYCDVPLSWNKYIPVSPSEASKMASELQKLATHIVDVDASLQETYDVHRGNTTYHQPYIRCAMVGTRASSIYKRCQLSCVHAAAEKYTECLQDESGAELLLCLTGINLGFGSCLRNC